MSTENNTLYGWAGIANDQPLQEMRLPLRQWSENCVDIDISHCGICGSDVHTLEDPEEWVKTNYPCVVGHEIAGTVTRIGQNVTHIKVGDRVGVGAQSGACHRCDHCQSGHENVCYGGRIGTYNSTWETGDKTFGGYADKWRGDYRFVFKIPDSISNEVAATLFCAGVTTFAPLKRTHVNATSVVGIMGLGGLGHYGVLWAKAMGAKAVAISSGDYKREVAKELGCDDYINSRDPEDLKRYTKKFSHILCTGCSPDFEWNTYLGLIHCNGYFLNVNHPRWKFPAISPLVLIRNQCFIHGSAVGSPADIREMLAFAAEKQVKPWLQKYPMKDINQAIQDFKSGQPRFRFVLEN
ncbi:chaperonin 10-like protein [Gilbertella persicaria]|uniref:chaperonin 10-like protein n=1 Tax=Gilbertella persicaria TaxID=101096 RepID=UPI002220A259|nr:chaperonin 10-like protein [Gilbertella persicaria]KAI8090153.1 chaperonin 10-like protein [Gilbertella persicaria]